MKIELSDEYILNSDPYCVWITQKVRRKNGTGCYERVFNGYHANIQDCLVSFVRKSVNVSQAHSILELADEVEQINQTIKNFAESITVNIRNIPTEKQAPKTTGRR